MYGRGRAPWLRMRYDSANFVVVLTAFSDQRNDSVLEYGTYGSGMKRPPTGVLADCKALVHLVFLEIAQNGL